METEKTKERAWDLHFERWYLIAPSGNRYNFWRGCYFPTVYVPTTYQALSEDDKSKFSDVEIRQFRKSGKKTKCVYYKSFIDGKMHNYNQPIGDEYEQVLNYVYQIEEAGGFPDQKKMNKWLEGNREMNYLFSNPQSKAVYDSMPC